MSWLATKYAWKCRHGHVKGSVRLVLLALALRVRKHYISTTPTSLGVLCRLTFLSDDAVRRCLDTLEAVGELRRIRRGKRATYALAKMAGPLFIETPQDAVFLEDMKTPQDAVFLNRKMRGNSRRSAGGVLLSSGTSTNQLAPTTDEKSAAVEAFLEWFLAEYQRHRGVLYRASNAAKAEAAVRELLSVYDDDTLRAMSLAMWADRVEPWLNDPKKPNDRGIFSLRQKATYLQTCLRPVDAAPRRAWSCPHLEPCGHRAMCEVKLANPTKYPVRQEAFG